MSARLSLHPVVSYVQQLADEASCAAASDRQLLERFARERDQDAFRTLVRRHGPLVFGVGLRALKHRQDAEDCFQATFLVLARKAGAVRWQESIGPWLHQVATRLAAELRGRELRRQKCERQAVTAAESCGEEPGLRDLAAVVDEELNRLPERCRGAMLLCVLEGQSRDEAAQALGLPLRTLERRLQEGRVRLRDRLRRRGITLSAALAAWGLMQDVAVAGELTTVAVESACHGGSTTMTSSAALLAAQMLRAMAWENSRWLMVTGLACSFVAAVISMGVLSTGSAAPIDDGRVVEIAVQGKEPGNRRVPIQEIGTANAVKNGLLWLARRQEADGRWKFDGRADNDVAATALALVSFLEADETQVRLHKDTIARGLKYLVAQQNAEGAFDRQMYANAMATWAMCDGVRVHADAKLKTKAQLGLTYLVKAQHEKGGWRYAPGQAGDTSVTSWQLIALKKGQTAGLHVPAETFAKASAYLDSVASDGGAAYGYVPGPNSSVSMTAAGLCSRQLLGWDRGAAALQKGGARLAEMAPQRTGAYCYFFATYAIRGGGGESWEKWENQLTKYLCGRQEAGSWSPEAGDVHGEIGGRLFVTTLSLLALQQCGQLEAPIAARELKEGDAERLWRDLRDDELAKARHAISALTASPQQTVPFLRKNLRPAKAADAKKAETLIKDLGAGVFQTRTRAFDELKSLGEGAIPYLRKALKEDPDVELRRRVESLLELATQKAQSLDRLREMRAVQVLELIGTAEARELLETISQGAADIGVTQAACDALERLRKK